MIAPHAIIFQTEKLKELPKYSLQDYEQDRMSKVSVFIGTPQTLSISRSRNFQVKDSKLEKQV